MFITKQIEKITEAMKKSNIDILLIGPSADLQYLTNLHPLTDERFKGLLILQNKKFFYIAPELYYEETRDFLGEETEIITWGDAEGFLKAIREADRKFGLAGKKIGVNDGIRAVDIIDIENFIDVSFVNGSSIMENIKLIKTEEERENLRIAAQIADKCAKEILSYIKPGITEKDIKDALEDLLIKNGGEEIAFETIIASGPNSSKPHYNEYGRTIEEHDVIIMDFGCKYHGYCSDTSRTVFVGEPTDEQKKIYSIVLEANEKGEAAAKAGATAEEVDAAARNVIIEAGYGQYFFNRVGHGVGTAVHEGPYIKGGNKLVLGDGMVFSVEPGIYIAGKFGMRVEDIVLINGKDAEILNKSYKGLTIVK